MGFQGAGTVETVFKTLLSWSESAAGTRGVKILLDGPRVVVYGHGPRQKLVNLLRMTCECCFDVPDDRFLWIRDANTQGWVGVALLGVDKNGELS